MMKTKSTKVVAILAIFVCLGVAAEDGGSSALRNEEFGEARALLQMGREDIIRDEIRFSEAESAAFWPSYDAYRGDVMKVRNRQADVVIAYLEAYRDGTVSEEQARQLLDDALAIKGDLRKIQKKHLKHFRKVLPAWKATRFYQLENKLDAELDVQLARFVPLMEPT